MDFEDKFISGNIIYATDYIKKTFMYSYAWRCFVIMLTCFVNSVKQKK